MVKTLAASTLFAAAAADTIALTFIDCGSDSTHATITDLSPAQIEVPGKASVVGSGDLDSDQTSASFTLKVKKLGIPLVSGKGSICEDTTIKLPLGAGSFTVKGIDCPVKQGKTAVQVDLDILSSDFFKSEDDSNALVNIHIEANADDTGDQVICLDIAASQAAYEKEWAEFQAVNGERNGDIPQAFKDNVDRVRAHDANTAGYTMSYTGPFADMTLEEFQAANIRGFKQGSASGLPNLGMHEGTYSGATIDWTTKGAVTPVKNQGQCGSCWAFSTTGGLEGAWQLASGNLVSMSEQQFVDCDKVDSGCNGGLMDNAFNWAEKQAVATESSYAYTGRDGSCKSSFTTAIPQGGVTGYKDVTNSADGLKSALENSPVSVAIEADQMAFQMYSGGVITSGCGSNLDHGVLAVGINSDGSIKVKNSWGSSWGVNGYVNIATNQCGITTSASYPTVSGSVAV